MFFEKITYNDAGQFVSWEDNYLYKAITEYSADGQLALGAKIYDNEEVIFSERVGWDKNKQIESHVISRLGDEHAGYELYGYDAMNRLTHYTYGLLYGHYQQFALLKGDYHYNELGILNKKKTCGNSYCMDYAAKVQEGYQVQKDALVDEDSEMGCGSSGYVKKPAFLESLIAECDETSRGYDAAGNLEKLHVAATGEECFLSWDAMGRLVRINSPGKFRWRAVYDGLGRRLLTTYEPHGGEAQVVRSYYDPEVEFLEIGVRRGDAVAWKIYGSDANGSYGGLQGIGGLQLIVEAGVVDEELEEWVRVAKPITDLQGHIAGFISDDGDPEGYLSINWHYRGMMDPYGPLSKNKKSLEAFGNEPLVEALAKSHIWRGKRQEVMGLINMGARYYDPTIGRFISADPVWPWGQHGPLQLCEWESRVLLCSGWPLCQCIVGENPGPL